jgi:WD40 repeat protein
MADNSFINDQQHDNLFSALRIFQREVSKVLSNVLKRYHSRGPYWPSDYQSWLHQSNNPRYQTFDPNRQAGALLNFTDFPEIAKYYNRILYNCYKNNKINNIITYFFDIKEYRNRIMHPELERLRQYEYIDAFNNMQKVALVLQMPKLADTIINYPTASGKEAGATATSYDKNDKKSDLATQTVGREQSEELRAFKSVVKWHIKNGSFIESVSYSPYSRTLASGSLDGKIRLWDAFTGKCRGVLQGHQKGVKSVAYSPDGRTLASGSWDNKIRLWDVASGECLRVLRGHVAEVTSVAYSLEGQTLASGSRDGKIRLWDAGTVECLRVLEGHQLGVESVAYSPDGRTLASGSSDETIRLRDTATGECRQVLKGHQEWIVSVAYSPDSRTLASGSWDKTIRLWDTGTGECRQALEGHEDRVTSVAYSPDGRTLASGSSDGKIRLWDAATGACRRVLWGHQEWVMSVAYSPDGQTLASGSKDSSIRFWHAASGQLLLTILYLQEGSLCFTPDGYFSATEEAIAEHISFKDFSASGEGVTAGGSERKALLRHYHRPDIIRQRLAEAPQLPADASWPQKKVVETLFRE